MKRPSAAPGLRHVALHVRDLAVCERFYLDLLGMSVQWRPDERNLYLSSGSDNLALHQAPPGDRVEAGQRLDHIGFFVETPEQVDQWYAYLESEGVPVGAAPRDHRDGARSFYCQDPDGTSVQIICHPP